MPKLQARGCEMGAVLPSVAISVRQPWAWAILHAGKDVENRNIAGPWLHLEGTAVTIHAAKGMTRAEYAEARAFMASLGITAPPAGDLVRGALVGVVGVRGVVTASSSPWFFGPYGIAMKNLGALREPVPCKGALGVFRWVGRETEAVAPSLKWMVKS